jgi:hypothetical protein
MANEVLDVACPCCHTALRVDKETGAVLSHKMPEKPPAIEDLGIAAKALKGEAAKREEIFQKSFAEQKTRQSLLDKKFDELLKQAKESPDTAPPKRDIDL